MVMHYWHSENLVMLVHHLEKPLCVMVTLIRIFSIEADGREWKDREEGEEREEKGTKGRYDDVEDMKW
jgi:hypothetical protein